MADTALMIPSNFVQKKQEMQQADQTKKVFDPLKKDMHEMLFNMVNYEDAKKETFVKLLAFLDAMLEKMGISVRIQEDTKRESEKDQKNKKIQDDINKDTKKNVVKKKWYEKVAGYLKDALEKPAGFFSELFKWMLVFALLGPELVLSIVKMLGGLINWLLKLFMSFIPKMVDATVKVIIGVLPLIWGIFKMLGMTILEGIKASFLKIFDPKSSMYDRLKGLIELILYIGVAFITFYKVFSKLLSLIGFLSNGFLSFGSGLISLFTKIWNFPKATIAIFTKMWAIASKLLTSIGNGVISFFRNIVTVLTWVGRVISYIFQSVISFITSAISTAFRAITAAIGPIGWIIIALVTVVALIWTFSDSISKWFDNLIKWVTDWYNSLGPTMKMIVMAIGAIFGPIIIAVLFLVKTVSTLAKLFNYLKREGLSGIASSLKDFFTGLGTKIGDWIYSSLKSIWDSLKGAWNKLADIILGGISFLLYQAKHILSGGGSATFEQFVSREVVEKAYQVSDKKIEEIVKTGRGAVTNEKEAMLYQQLQQEGVQKDATQEQILAALERIAKKETTAKLQIDAPAESSYKSGKLMEGK